MEDVLMHYGILGMKWGVRRTPEQLGHKLKTGSKVYRTTPNPDEDESGSTYVTFADPDRDFYKGTFANGIREYYKLEPDDPLYESVYSLREDLKIPTERHVSEVVNRIAKENDSEKLKEIGKLRVKETIEEYNEFKSSMKRDYPNYSDQDIEDEWVNYYGGFMDEKKQIRFLMNLTPKQLYVNLTREFGSERIVKERVISELKSEGYNAMLDQAGSGGKEGQPIEGYAPLIIFDRESTLDKLSVAMLDKRDEESARKRRNTWSIRDRSTWKNYE